MNQKFLQPAIEDMETAYDNSGRVENSSELVSNYISDAADYRHEMADFIDFGQDYGKRERNQLDLFWPDRNKTAPLVMFIHGGYWQRLDRSTFSHMAKGLNAHGVAVAIPSYTLCPDINISGIIDEIRRACIILWKTYDRPITVIGHSAGGHLAACMLATKWNRIHNALPAQLVKSALAISGVFELAPLMKTSINIALKLTPEEARTASPYNWMIEPGMQFDAWVGQKESSEFLRQSRSQAQRWRMMGATTRYQEIAGANHFSAIHPLSDPKSGLVKRVLQLMQPVEAPTIESLNIPEHRPRPIDERQSVEKTADANNSEKPDKPAVVEQDITPVDTPAPERKSLEQNTDPAKAEDISAPEDEPAMEKIAPVKVVSEPKSAIGTESPTGQVQPENRAAKIDEPIEESVPAAKISPDAEEAALETALAAALEDGSKEVPEEGLDHGDETPVEAKPDTDQDKIAGPSTDSPSPQSEALVDTKESSDDLTIISGIGDVLCARLNDLGFTTFAQLADLSEPQKEMIEDILDFKGRIEREHWITQARHQQAIKDLAIILSE